MSSASAENVAKDGDKEDAFCQASTSGLGSDRGGDSKYTAPRLNLSLQDFELLRILGEGSMSLVVEALWKEYKKKFAIKILDKFFLQRNNATESVVRERSIMDRLRSDLVVQLRFTFQDSRKLYMGMDLCPNGDLFEQLQMRKPLPLPEVKFYAAEIVLILEYIHGQGIIYRDMKPENLLLTEDGHLKLTDFGTAKFADPSEAEKAEPATTTTRSGKQVVKRAVSFVGTADYVAPEILNNTSCTRAVDLWGLGCVIYQLLFSKPPFRDKSEYLIFQRVTARSFKFPEVCPDNGRDLVDKLLVLDPEARLGMRGFDEIKNHAFFEGIDWSTIRQQKAPEFHKVERRDSDADRWEMQSLMQALPSPHLSTR